MYFRPQLLILNLKTFYRILSQPKISECACRIGFGGYVVQEGLELVEIFMQHIMAAIVFTGIAPVWELPSLNTLWIEWLRHKIHGLRS